MTNEAKFTGPMRTLVSQCQKCAHYQENFVCGAFPGGIPPSIYVNKVSHKKPIDGDHGIQFKAK